MTAPPRTRKPRDADEITFIQTRSGTVHVLTCNDSDDNEPDEDLSFAEGLLKMTFSRPAMVCGRRMRIDWVGFASNPTAEPAGAFDDEQLCASCLRAMGDQSSLVFERRNEDDRNAFRVQEMGQQ